MRRVKGESDDGRSAPYREYEWLRGVEVTEGEDEARRKHRKLPPLRESDPPQVKHLRRIRGGRGNRKAMSPLDYSPEQMRRRIAYLERRKKPKRSIEKRLRRAKMREQVTMQIKRAEIVELVAICDRLSGTGMVDVRWMRAAMRGVMERVGAIVERRGAEHEAELNEIYEQGMYALSETKGTEGAEDLKGGGRRR